MTDEQLRPNSTSGIAISVCNSADIMPRIIKVYKTRAIYGLFLVSVCTIGMIIASSVCFVLAKQNEDAGLDKIKSMTYGIILAIVSFILLISVFVLCRALCIGFKWMNKILRTIQLNGILWQHQVDSLQTTVPRSMLGPCVGNIHGRLRMRPNGYIILTEEGLIIDAFIAFRYKRVIVLRVDLINNHMQTGWILRVFLVTRSKSQSGPDKGKHISFQVDLYMPPTMQADEVNDIRQIILSNSHKHLVASKFYSTSQVNLTEHV